MAPLKALALLVAGGLIAGGAAVHNVDTAPTAEDRTYAGLILERAGYVPGTLAHPGGFDAEIAAVLAVQDAVLDATPLGRGLPIGHTREPKDIAEAGQGLCFDRSRAIEKILATLGMETRHLAIYAIGKQGRLRALLTPGVDSHAVTEVRTARGWIAVDSNARWIGLDAEGRVWSVEALRARDPFTVAWDPRVPERLSWAQFAGPFTYVIGLYSRHGGFFPPYTPVPDVNYAQLLANVF